MQDVDMSGGSKRGTGELNSEVSPPWMVAFASVLDAKLHNKVQTIFSQHNAMERYVDQVVQRHQTRLHRLDEEFFDQRCLLEDLRSEVSEV